MEIRTKDFINRLERIADMSKGIFGKKYKISSDYGWVRIDLKNFWGKPVRHMADIFVELNKIEVYSVISEDCLKRLKSDYHQITRSFLKEELKYLNPGI